MGLNQPFLAKDAATRRDEAGELPRLAGARRLVRTVYAAGLALLMAAVGLHFSPAAVLATGAVISGRVTDSNGNGVESIKVCLYQQVDDGMGGTYWNQYGDCTSTDGNGDYDVGGLAAGTYRVGFFDGRSPQEFLAEFWNDKPDVDAADNVTLSEGETRTDIHAALARAGKITGRVTDSEGTPITQFGVHAWRWADDGSGGGVWSDYWYGYAQIDATGVYTVAGLRDGIFALHFETSGDFVNEYYDDKPDLASATGVPVSLGQITTDIDAILTPAAHISGTVSGSSGSGLQNISVCIYRELEDGAGGTTWSGCIAHRYTDANGDYDVGGLASGTHRVRFSDAHFPQQYFSEFWNDKPDIQSADNVTVTEGNTQTGIDAGLVKGGHIAGRVTDSDSNGLANVKVCLYQQVDDGAGGTHWSGCQGETWTDANGDYDVGGLAAGTYRVGFFDGRSPQVFLAEFWNDKPDVDAADNVPVSEGETRTDIHAALARAGKITGRVTDSGGAPITQFGVHAWRWADDGSGGGAWSDYWYGYAQIDASGVYTVAGLRDGVFALHFETSGDFVNEYYDDKPDLASATGVTVSLGEITTDIDAVLTPAAHISGTVSGSVAPLDRFTVALYRQELDGSGGWWWKPFTYSFGSGGSAYAIGGLPAGVYRMGFSDPLGNYLPEFHQVAPTLEGAKDIPLAAGDSVTINAHLTAAQTLSGRVTGPGGAGLAGIDVRLYRSEAWGWQWLRSTSSNANGDYSFGIAAAGIYRVGFYDPTGAYAPRFYSGALTVDAATDVPMDLQSDVTGIDAVLTAAGGIAGLVTGPTGAPLAGITVTAYRYAGGHGEWIRQTTTDSSGLYSLGGLGSDAYRLHFADPSGVYAYTYFVDAVTLDGATGVAVTAGAPTAGINAVLSLPAPPAVYVIAPTAGISSDPRTGEVIVSMTWNALSNIAVWRNVTCPLGGVPQDVTLVATVGGVEHLFAMTETPLGSSGYVATIPDDILTANVALTVRQTCGGVQVGAPVAQIVLHNSLGKVTDADTGWPVPGAAVTLYRAVGWAPRSGPLDMEPNTCESILSKPSGEAWSQTAPSDLITPSASRQFTDAAGRFGWDLAPGCWYVVVQRTGYHTQVSPIVGVPPAVTDLNVPLSSSAVAAGFSGAPRSGEVPLTVTFTDQSVGPVTAWAWSFGDGGASTEQNPVHTYTAAGIYTVRLTVTDSDTGDTDTRTQYIGVHDVAIGGLSASNNGPAPLGQPVTVNASLTAGTGVAYTWDYGDGSYGSGASAQHTYADVGVYLATVTAFNSAGSQQAATQVIVQDEAILGLSLQGPGLAVVDQPASFTAQTTQGTNVIFAWDFGDNALGAAATVSSQTKTHAFAAPGVYTVKVTAANAKNVATDSLQVTVIDQAVGGLTAANSSPTLLGAGTVFTATATSGSGIVYTWDFGDGSQGSGRIVTHPYTHVGDFQATVTAVNTAGTSEATTVVQVINPRPQTASVAGAVFVDGDGDGVRDGAESGLAGVQVTLTDLSGGVQALSPAMYSGRVRATQTDVTGAYAFAGVPYGLYRLAFALPSQYVPDAPASVDIEVSVPDVVVILPVHEQDAAADDLFLPSIVAQ